MKNNVKRTGASESMLLYRNIAGADCIGPTRTEFRVKP
jgi:hypothetical protein